MHLLCAKYYAYHFLFRLYVCTCAMFEFTGTSQQPCGLYTIIVICSFFGKLLKCIPITQRTVEFDEYDSSL